MIPSCQAESGKNELPGLNAVAMRAVVSEVRKGDGSGMHLDVNGHGGQRNTARRARRAGNLHLRPSSHQPADDLPLLFTEATPVKPPSGTRV